jgi:uncharacterized protein YjcR
MTNEEKMVYKGRVVKQSSEYDGLEANLANKKRDRNEGGAEPAEFEEARDKSDFRRGEHGRTKLTLWDS